MSKECCCFAKGKIFYECETKLEETEEVNPQTERHAGVSSLNVFHRLETGAMSHFDWDTGTCSLRKVCVRVWSEKEDEGEVAQGPAKVEPSTWGHELISR